MKFSKAFAAAAALVVAGAFAPAQAAPQSSNDNQAPEGLVQLICAPSEGFDSQLKLAFDLARGTESNEVDTGKIVLYTNEANDSYVMVLELNDAARAANNIPVPASCLIGEPSLGLKEFRASPVFPSIFPKP
jgi:hypothetical protein